MTALPVDLCLENERLQRELAQVRAELENFIHSVSHDLRAPLRHVNAYVEIIREDLGEPTLAAVAPHLDRVQQAARHMGQQIDGLMALSRLTQLALQLAPVAPGPLIDEVCAELAPTGEGRIVAWQVAPDFPLLQCDTALLRQVLTHLLSNALKFTRGCKSAQIELSWRYHASGQCVLTVSDNGVGFNPDYGKKLFHAFQRLHGAREFEGLGVGLALTRKIVERHGGTVSAEGVPGEGCRVSFTLPLASV
jgi:signal transduction histidine kinase